MLHKSWWNLPTCHLSKDSLNYLNWPIKPACLPSQYSITFHFISLWKHDLNIMFTCKSALFNFWWEIADIFKVLSFHFYDKAHYLDLPPIFPHSPSPSKKHSLMSFFYSFQYNTTYSVHGNSVYLASKALKPTS